VKRILAATLLLCATTAILAQTVQDLVRSAESYRAHGELAARLAANDLLGVFKSAEKYFRNEAPDDGARMLAEAAAAFLWFKDIGSAKGVLADPVFASPSIKGETKYFQTCLLWACGAAAEPARQAGREAFLGRVLFIKGMALSDMSALLRLEEILPTPRRVLPTSPSSSLLLAALGRVSAKELAVLDAVGTQWPSVSIPLSGGGSATFYFYDPALLFAYSRALLIEASKAPATRTYIDVTRAFLLGDYDGASKAIESVKDADYRYQALAIAIADRRKKDTQKLIGAFESRNGGDPAAMATGALYLTKYADLPAVSVRWLAKARIKAGEDAPMYTQVGSYLFLKAGQNADSFDAFRRYIDGLISPPAARYEEWISYYCISLFENGRHDGSKGKEIVHLLSTLEDFDYGKLVWVAIRCASQYYTDNISPMEYHNANG
jgi:hypothetical protein